MRTWLRAQAEGRCGLCRQSFRRATPIQVIQIVGMARRLIRCPLCAEGTPPELPPLTEPEPVRRSHPVTRIVANVAGMARDWKTLQSGER